VSRDAIEFSGPLEDHTARFGSASASWQTWLQKSLKTVRRRGGEALVSDDGICVAEPLTSNEVGVQRG
jgi:hypothetical protein